MGVIASIVAMSSSLLKRHSGAFGAGGGRGKSEEINHSYTISCVDWGGSSFRASTRRRRWGGRKAIAPTPTTKIEKGVVLNWVFSLLKPNKHISNPWVQQHAGDARVPRQPGQVLHTYILLHEMSNDEDFCLRGSSKNLGLDQKAVQGA